MSRPWTTKRLTDAAWRALELARRGLPLDHDLEGDRIKWGGRLQVILNLRNHGLVDDENNITQAGLDAFIPMPVKKRPDNRNKHRRDRCFACSSRSCYLRYYTGDGSFDEVACRAHETALHDRVIDMDEHTIVEEASGRYRVRRASKAGCCPGATD